MEKYFHIVSSYTGHFMKNIENKINIQFFLNLNSCDAYLTSIPQSFHNDLQEKLLKTHIITI